MQARFVAVCRWAALASLVLTPSACAPTAGQPERTSAPDRVAATASASHALPDPARVPPASAAPSAQARAELDAAFALALRETRAPYMAARAAILKHPDAKAYLSERHARSGDEREQFVASVLLGWLHDRPAYEEAHAWLSDGARRMSPNILGYVQAPAFGETIADEGGPSLALPLLEVWIKTFEHEQGTPREGPWGHGLWEPGYEEDALASALHALGDPRGYAPLLAIARDRGEPDGRRQLSTWALVGLRDPRVDDVLAGVLQDGSERESLRAVAADGLLERRPPQARALLEKVLLDARTSLPLRRELIRCLHQLNDLAAVPALERALERAREPELIEDLCFALDLLGDRKSLQTLWAAAARLRMGEPRRRCITAIESIRAHLRLPQGEQRVVPR